MMTEGQFLNIIGKESQGPFKTVPGLKPRGNAEFFLLIVICSFPTLLKQELLWCDG
jgi:hypothetical protein